MIKYINLMLFAGMIFMNYLANAIPLNNKNTGQISDSYPNLFVPAGITFSIWGIIYALLAGYCITQFTGINLSMPKNLALLFAASCVINALWIVCWHYEKMVLSVLIMIALLVTLIVANLEIKNLSFGIVKASFGVYLGWICIATIANVTALLVKQHWNGFGLGDEAWAIIMISAGALITVAAVYRLNNPFIGLAVTWALAGIIIKRQADFKSIVIVSAIAILLVGVITVAGFLGKTLQGMG